MIEITRVIVPPQMKSKIYPPGVNAPFPLPPSTLNIDLVMSMRARVNTQNNSEFRGPSVKVF